MALVPTFIDGFYYNFTQTWVLQYLEQFDFQAPGLKVKDVLSVFRKNFVIALVPTFIDGF